MTLTREALETGQEVFVCTMTKDEFVGIFRTIGMTNLHDRMNDVNSRLSRVESEAVSDVYSDVYSEPEIADDRETKREGE